MSAGSDAVIWHDVENGAYDADLSLWRELAEKAGGPILDVGCGTGRVALDLAKRGHHVLGVDIEAEFVSALHERAAGLGLEAGATVGDVRDLRVEGRFPLIIVPMQTIQVLGDEDERRAAFRSMRELLAPRGLIAIAIVTGDLEAETAGFELGQPLPDVGEFGGFVYSSLPTELRFSEGRIVISRLRQVVTPDGDLTDERSELALATLDAEQLAGEALEAGLRAAGHREIAPTDAHVGSTVVLLEVAE